MHTCIVDMIQSVLPLSWNMMHFNLCSANILQAM